MATRAKEPVGRPRRCATSLLGPWSSSLLVDALVTSCECLLRAALLEQYLGQLAVVTLARISPVSASTTFRDDAVRDQEILQTPMRGARLLQLTAWRAVMLKPMDTTLPDLSVMSNARLRCADARRRTPSARRCPSGGSCRSHIEVGEDGFGRQVDGLSRIVTGILVAAVHPKYSIVLRVELEVQPRAKIGE